VQLFKTYHFVKFLFYLMRSLFGFSGTGSSVLLLIKMDPPGGGRGGGGGGREFEEGAKVNITIKPSSHLFSRLLNASGWCCKSRKPFRIPSSYTRNNIGV
jgi:hypothetical protein